MRIFYFSGNADKRSKKDDDEDDSKDEDGDNSDSVDNDAEVKWKKKASKLLGIDRWWGGGISNIFCFLHKLKKCSPPYCCTVALRPNTIILLEIMPRIPILCSVLIERCNSDNWILL